MENSSHKEAFLFPVTIFGGMNRLSRRKTWVEVLKKKMKQADSTNSDMEDTSLQNVLNPLYICLCCFGLFWRKRSNWLKRGKCNYDLCTLHCCVTITLAWINNLKYFVAYDGSETYGSALFLKILPHLVSLQMAFCITSYVYHRHKHVRGITQQWVAYRNKHGGSVLTEIKEQIFKTVICVNFIVLVSQISWMVFVNVKRPARFVSSIMPFSELINFDSVPVYIFINNVISMYLSLAWYQSVLSFICISFLIKKEFEHLTDEFKDNVFHKQDSSSPMLGNYTNELQPKKSHNTIEHYRQRHLELCKLVAIFDDGNYLYLLFIYLFSLPIVVILMFAAISQTSNPGTKDVMYIILSLSIVIVFVSILIVITMSASRLANSVSTISHYVTF